MVFLGSFGLEVWGAGEVEEGGGLDWRSSLRLQLGGAVRGGLYFSLLCIPVLRNACSCVSSRAGIVARIVIEEVVCKW